MRRPYLFLAALLSGVLASAPALAARPSYPLQLTTERAANGHQVVLTNDGPSPVTTIVTLSGFNIDSNRNWPATVVVPPFTRVVVGKLGPITPSLPSSHEVRGDFELGDVYKRPDPDAVYRLPYADGQAFTITQAPDGPLRTHLTADNRHAIDFAMPEGIPVLAAREGVVVETVDGYTESGNDPRLAAQTNSVTVLHADGTFGLYAHLAPGTVAVRRGEPVRAGQPIGRAGDTGYSVGSHLHFAVVRPVVDPAQGRMLRHSVPVRFYVGAPATVFAPRAGMTVLAQYGRPVASGELATERERAISAAVAKHRERKRRAAAVWWAAFVVFGTWAAVLAMRSLYRRRAFSQKA